MPNYKPMPELKRLRELLLVTPIPLRQIGKSSGLIWRVNRGGTAKAGSRAGSRVQNSKQKERFDWVLCIDGINYFAARVIYYMIYEVDPKNYQVDHKDRNADNNNASNLRLDIDGELQKANRSIYKNNTSGIIGVTWDKKTQKWNARLRGKNKPGFLGLYSCKIAAAFAIRSAYVEYELDTRGKTLPVISDISCDCSFCASTNKYEI